MSVPMIAVVGAGLVGQKHVAMVAARGQLAAVIDPNPKTQALAAEFAAPWFADLEAFFASKPVVDGVILATPNQLHVAQGLVCVAHGLPVLIEKPIADKSEAAFALVQEADNLQVPLLIGHHRRHNPLIATAKSFLDSGQFGALVSVHAQFWLYKPDDYYAMDWRTRTGAGPVFINLIHDIDLLRYLCGEVVHVQARESRKSRGFEVEDTAVILLEFANGALGTVNVSDTIVAPWSWELTAGENPAYHQQPQESSYLLGGDAASLSVPDLKVWRHPGAKSWWNPLEAAQLDYQRQDPLERQLDHFNAVISGGAAPLVSGEEGLRTLRVVEAIKQAAETGKSVALTKG